VGNPVPEKNIYGGLTVQTGRFSYPGEYKNSKPKITALKVDMFNISTHDKNTGLSGTDLKNVIT
jgi:hypothetical protein